MHTEKSECCGGWLAGWKSLLVVVVLASLLAGSWSCNRSSKMVQNGTKSERPAEDKAETEHAKNRQPSKTDETKPIDLDTPGPSAQRGRELYAQHCVACHGADGDGKGIAARFLFPKPRDLRAARFRLVSTTNYVSTKEDLHAVLVRGMPGSAMPPWAHLSEGDRNSLVEELFRLRREGAREQYIRILKEHEELTDEELAEEDVQQEITEFVESRSIPGESTKVPDVSEPNEESIARGKEIYLKLSCHSCHGEGGKGDGVQKMVDSEGYPTTPRDYTVGIFKGGHDPTSLYRRIAYGMPGTPMPSTSENLATPEQLVDLVHFIRSLSDEEVRQAAVLKRRRLVAKRVNEIPDIESGGWADVDSMGLRMMPLWWRDNADPGLEVQAIHDGTTIAIRLSWGDETQDSHAARTESFEDAVAVELYRGDAEPFIGMGDAKSPVDVWFWDADRQTQQFVEKTYPNIVVDTYPFSEKQVATASFDRPGTRTSDQPDVSLPARASGNPIVPAAAESGASTLTVGGPGTVTFRLPQSQLVTAHGKWSQGRWSVVMARPLEVGSESDGVSLEPGVRASIAVAVWDGSQRDRDGKKLITIWHDLELEN